MWCDWKHRQYPSKGEAASFQFQCGAIGSANVRERGGGVTMFQFQCGAIGRAYRIRRLIAWSKFQFQCGAIGSIPFWVCLYNYTWFQFQCGAIGRLVSAIKLNYPERFNSSVVRLEDTCSNSVPAIRPVSIPVWCDWKAPTPQRS